MLTIAQKTFRAWERLRILYLLILVPSAIAMAKLIEVGEPSVGSTVEQSQSETAMILIVGGLFANVGYLAGPLVEVYARWLGFAPGWLRPVLFTAGTLLTLGLAFLSLAAASF